MPVIQLKKVNYTVYSGQTQLHILKDVCLSIVKGVSLAITGRSGSGKTTLLNVMAGLDVPTSGEVTFQDQVINTLDEDCRAKLRAKKVGFIFQSFHLLPSLTAVENVMLPLEINGEVDAQERAYKWLDRVGLAQRSMHYPNQLSGGEQQRVAIARAFSIEPDVLFADEPTGNLDKQNALNVMDLLFGLKKEHGSSLIIVTHDEELASRCETHQALDDGILQ